MKFAADYRLDARNKLQNKWGVAVLAGFLAVLLGALSGSGPKININIDLGSIHHSFSDGHFKTHYLLGNIHPILPLLVAGEATIWGIIAIAISLAVLGLGAIVGVGYASFNLHLHEDASINRMFNFFPYWKNIIASKLWRILFITLWTFLLIIPGLVASFSYSMTDFVLAEHPEMSGREAIALSKEMMYGHRWRLFCLEFSFIGWAILDAFTLGIGSLWLTPYVQAARASFYQELCRQ